MSYKRVKSSDSLESELPTVTALPGRRAYVMHR